MGWGAVWMHQSVIGCVGMTRCRLGRGGCQVPRQCSYDSAYWGYRGGGGVAFLLCVKRQHRSLVVCAFAGRGGARLSGHPFFGKHTNKKEGKIGRYLSFAKIEPDSYKNNGTFAGWRGGGRGSYIGRVIFCVMFRRCNLLRESAFGIAPWP